MTKDRKEGWRDGFLAGWLAAGGTDEPGWESAMGEIQQLLTGETFFGTKVGPPMTLSDALDAYEQRLEAEREKVRVSQDEALRYPENRGGHDVVFAGDFGDICFPTDAIHPPRWFITRQQQSAFEADRQATATEILKAWDEAGRPEDA